MPLVPVLGFWVLDPLYISLGTLLAWFYQVIPSFGVAIMLLTVAVSVLRMPLVRKQVKSQQAMQLVQPEIKRIQAKHKADPQKRNEELMRVYKENGVNPLAGCLPLVLQMPLMLVLYRLIHDLNASSGPKHVPTTSSLYSALVDSGGSMRSFGMDLADRASDVNGLVSLLPYAVLIALVVATGFYQTRQMQSRLPKESLNPQMQMVGKVFPVVFGFISFSIPAGVVLYFVVSNCFQIGQQAWLFRHGPAGRAPKGRGGAGKGAGTVDAVDGPEPPAVGPASKGPRGPKGRTSPAASNGTDGRRSGGGKVEPGGSGGRASGGRSGRAGIGGRGGRGAPTPERNGTAGGTAARGGRPGAKPSGRVTPPKGGRSTPPPQGKNNGGPAGKRARGDQRKDG